MLLLPSELFNLILSYSSPTDIGRLSISSKIFTNLSNSAAKDLLVALFQRKRTVDLIRRCASNNNISFLNEGCPALTILNGLFERSKLAKPIIEVPARRKSMSTSSIRILNDVSVDRVLLLGGQGEGKCHKGVVMWTPSTNTWSTCSGMKSTHGSFYVEAVSLNSEVYVISGDNFDSAGTMEKYNYIDDKWTLCASMPKKTMFISAAAVENKIVVSGGLEQSSGEFSRDIYTCSNEVWALAGLLSAARYGHASIYFEGKLWMVCGHFEGELTYSNTVEILDTTTMDTVPGPPTVVSRIWPRLLTSQGRLFAIGGDSLVTKSSPSIEVYDSAAGIWKVVTYFKSPRKLFSSVAVGTKIYIFGGKDEAYCNIATFDVYDISTDTWCCPDEGTHAGISKNNNSIPSEHFHGGQAISVSFS